MGCSGRAVWSGQTPNIDFAVRRQREVLKHYETRWNHVSGQLGAQVFAQLSHLQRAIFRLYIGRQAFLATAVFAGDHNCVGNRIVLAQGRFDLPQFNAKTANFYLMIDSAQGTRLSHQAGTVRSRPSCKCGRDDL